MWAWLHGGGRGRGGLGGREWVPKRKSADEVKGVWFQVTKDHSQHISYMGSGGGSLLNYCHPLTHPVAGNAAACSPSLLLLL